MHPFKATMLILAVVALGLVLCFGLEWLGIGWRGFFGPKHAAVEREVFKQSRSYNEAKEQELLKYKLEYDRSTTEQDRKALAFTIRHKFADYDERLLSPELQSFLRKMKSGQ